ncbi:PIR Superfamily Protein [Plasmodium ovale curtisi]|uniref:PIR Superfamily Protein n=1 Tax=Plasmodium ovale curtisi TaxID=864141 RepID=A0A1A8VUF2_PLAOA|nr:PIR Superfamily Protein [Plasmodium ovale curtisi]
MLLNYWLYDKLSEYFVNDENYIDIAYASIEYIWSNLVTNPSESSYYQKCKPLFKEILNHKEWKKGKELYDYCINYELIAPTCTFYDKKCTEYCEYIKKQSYLYEHFEKVCDTKESYCPKFYERCKNYNPKIVLDTLNCHEKLKAERYSTSENSATHHPSGQINEFGAGEHGSKTSEIGTKVGNSVLGVAPVLLTATALYRYTPVGSWIRKLGGTNNNSMSNINGEEMDGFFGDSENYISYQPM